MSDERPDVETVLSRARVAYGQGQRNEAIRQFKAALRLARELHEAYDTRNSHEQLLMCLMEMATLSRLIGRADAEVNYLRKASSEAEALASTGGTRTDRRVWASIITDLTRALAGLQELEPALEMARLAIAQFRSLHEKTTDRAQSASDLAAAFDDLAAVLVAQGKSDKALEFSTRALALREEAHEANPDPSTHRLLRDSLSQQAQTALRAGRAHPSIARYEQLLREEIAADPDGNDAWNRLELAALLYQVGRGYLSQGSQKAWGQLTEAWELLEGVRRTHGLQPGHERIYEVLTGDLKARSYRRSGREGVTPTPEALLQAVFRNPKDDAVRLVLADALSEAGDPRGEFISLQCQPSSAASVTRQRKLLRDFARDWFEPLIACGAELPTTGAEGVFVRGFPTRVTMGTRARAGAFAKNPAWATVEELTARRFEFHPNLASLRRLYAVETAGDVQVPPLQRLIAGQECLESNSPFTSVDEVACLVENSDDLCSILRGLKSKWFRSVKTVLTFDVQFAEAARVLSSAKTIERVVFLRELVVQFFPLRAPPSFDFELRRSGELTVTLFAGTKFDEAELVRAAAGAKPLRLIVQPGPGVARRVTARLEKVLINALSSARPTSA